jgi:hypothetical protein
LSLHVGEIKGHLSSETGAAKPGNLKWFPLSMDWFTVRESFTGNSHIQEKQWFPVEFPLNQSIDW